MLLTINDLKEGMRVRVKSEEEVRRLDELGGSFVDEMFEELCGNIVKIKHIDREGESIMTTCGWCLAPFEVELIETAVRQQVEEMVTITKKEYDSLLEDREFLDALRCAGVDNWSGYGFAMEMLEEEED